MKNKLIFLFLLFPTIFFAQNLYKQGVINFKDGTHLECYINVNQQPNKSPVKYKKDLKGEIIEAFTSQIDSFEIYDKIKYISSTVDFDRSSSKESSYSSERDPRFIKMTALLEVLVESKADLFKLTTDDDETRFYYRIDEGDIKPLIFKKYRLKGSETIFTNIDFISQINSDLKCEGIFATSTNVSYKENSLKQFFTLYNECVNADFVFKTVKEKAVFKLHGKAGYGIGYYKINFSPLSGRRVMDKFDSDFYNFGFIGELNLPYPNRRYSLIGELSYIDLSAEHTTPPNAQNYYSDITLDIKGLKSSLGVRYNIYSNQSTSEYGIFYLEALFSFYISLQKGQVTELSKNIHHNSPLDKVHSAGFEPHFSFGAGVPIYKNLTGALRYDLGQDLLNNQGMVSLKFQSISFNLNYRIF